MECYLKCKCVCIIYFSKKTPHCNILTSITCAGKALKVYCIKQLKLCRLQFVVGIVWLIINYNYKTVSVVHFSISSHLQKCTVTLTSLQQGS
jgi:hypothetical protein